MIGGFNRYNSLEVEITSADPSVILDAAVQNGVVLKNIRNIDSLTVRIACFYKDIEKLAEIAQKYGGNCRVYRKRTDVTLFFKKRVALLIGSLLLAVVILTVPSRIFFVRITGNVSVPTAKILEEAELCGIRFGASRRTVRSEKVKNALLSSVPQLQWLGINTNGCVATISVQEKTKEEPHISEFAAGSIVASTDGIIQTCTVTNGTAMCAVGDAVLAGETLVSGYTDCGITLKEVRAKAEITALTVRSVTAVSPKPKEIRKQQLHKERKYSLRIGKKLINFFKDSGISDTSCVKIYSEECLSLPGGFELPVSLITIEYICYESSDDWQPDWNLWVPDGAKAHMVSNLQACQVISEKVQMDTVDDLCVFNGEYICLEDIGEFVNEEIVRNDRQTN